MPLTQTKRGVIQTKYGLLDPNPSAGDPRIPINLGVGPSNAYLSLYISKSFGFNKDKANKNVPRQRLNFGVSIDNALNINNKDNPIGNMSSPQFLRSINRAGTSGDSWPIMPRSISFSSSFSF